MLPYAYLPVPEHSGGDVTNRKFRDLLAVQPRLELINLRTFSTVGVAYSNALDPLLNSAGEAAIDANSLILEEAFPQRYKTKVPSFEPKRLRNTTNFLETA